MSTSTRRWSIRRAALGVASIVLSVALATCGVVLLVRANTLQSSPSRTNRAVVDTAATSEVVGQVTTALGQVLSYDYAKPQVADRAAAHWLTGDAPGQYKVLFAQLNKLAKGQKLTLVARVVSAGVTSLRANRAQLLVFVDQQSTRASDHQSSVSAAQVQITAVKHGSTWAISELKPL